MKFVELEVLAHIAGWHMRGFSLTCMSVQVQGTILNCCIDNADGKWGQLWEYVSRSMKVYALGNLKGWIFCNDCTVGNYYQRFVPGP